LIFWVSRKLKIVKGFDGLYFLNYLDLARADIIDKDELLTKHLGLLKTVLKKLELKKETDISITSKYWWLKEKTDKVLKKYKRYYYNEKAKESQTPPAKPGVYQF
jgi:hypothetical protein